MLQASKISSAQDSVVPRLQLVANIGPARLSKVATWLQVGLVYGLVEAALWTPLGPLNTVWIIAAVLTLLLSIRLAPFSVRDMGIAEPSVSAIGWTLLGGLLLAALIPCLSWALGDNLGPAHRLPSRQACQYAVWALVQQFILQSFFYVRLESMLGGKWAVPVTALLFGAVHIPNLVLTLTSFAAGLFFCEMFRRYRNIFVLGIVHAGLGLMMAACFADATLHRMRVGIGFLRFHS